MPSARIPSWWLVVGADTAFRLQELFAQVMAELPMSDTELARRLDLNHSTVARWAKGQTTPSPEKMLKAVEEVRAHLDRLLERASGAQKALRILVAAEEEANTAGRSTAGRREAARINKLLDDLGVEVPQYDEP